MLNTCDDLYEWVYSDKTNAKMFIKTLESVFRRKLILICDEEERTIVTCFSATKNNKKIRR